MSEITILDRLEEMRRIDKSGMLNIYGKTPDYCRDAVQRAKQIKIPKHVRISSNNTIEYKKPRHIIFAGMGGSVIWGEILRDWLRDEVSVPIEVCKEYTLPAYANKDTLVIAVSYSGNTGETISVFLDAVSRGCITLVLTSGGQLLNISEKLRIPHVKILPGIPPRTAISYLFFPLPVLMERIGVLSDKDGEVVEAIQVLEELSKETSPQTPTKINPSKKLALELDGAIPVVYGFGQYGAVARRLKTQFNENSKLPSKHDVFPELTHNEVVGWEALEFLTRQFSVILLRDHDESPEITHRIETTKLLALHKANKVLEIYGRGKKKLSKIISALYIGDLSSVYLAILRKTDPTPIETIEKIKVEMRKFNVNLKDEIQKITGKKL